MDKHPKKNKGKEEYENIAKEMEKVFDKDSGSTESVEYADDQIEEMRNIEEKWNAIAEKYGVKPFEYDVSFLYNQTKPAHIEVCHDDEFGWLIVGPDGLAWR